jgi:hypothetical protein
MRRASSGGIVLVVSRHYARAPLAALAHWSAGRTVLAPAASRLSSWAARRSDRRDVARFKLVLRRGDGRIPPLSAPAADRAARRRRDRWCCCRPTMPRRASSSRDLARPTSLLDKHRVAYVAVSTPTASRTAQSCGARYWGDITQTS